MNTRVLASRQILRKPGTEFPQGGYTRSAGSSHDRRSLGWPQYYQRMIDRPHDLHRRVVDLPEPLGPMRDPRTESVTHFQAVGWARNSSTRREEAATHDFLTECILMKFKNLETS